MRLMNIPPPPPPKKNNEAYGKRQLTRLGTSSEKIAFILGWHQVHRPVRLSYQPPANSTFLSEQINHQQPASNTFLSEQTSTSHQPNEQTDPPYMHAIS
jgi:hypothetical protein